MADTKTATKKAKDDTSQADDIGLGNAIANANLADTVLDEAALAAVTPAD